MKAAVVDIASLSVHRGAFCQFLFLWIYYYGSNKFTGKKTVKTHLCAVVCFQIGIFQKGFREEYQNRFGAQGGRSFSFFLILICLLNFAASNL